jgi:2-dehydro-3-deoxygluconokinase
VLTFGEAMIRVTPPFNERLESSLYWRPTVGGTELNVAVALRILGIESVWVSALPETSLGRHISRAAASAQVDISDLIWVKEDEGRTGLYFLEEGVVPRASTILYDRKDSAFAKLPPERYDWPSLMEGVDLFHVTGITLAVSPYARQSAMEAMREARDRGAVISFDLNYRARLWSKAEASEAFAEAIRYADVLFASPDALKEFFGIEGEGDVLLRNALDELGVGLISVTTKWGETSRQLMVRSEAMTADGMRASSGDQMIEVVDRIGGGDAFAGGFLAEYFAGSGDLARALAVGSAASAIKHTMPGDFLRATKEEIEDIAFGGQHALLRR